MLVRGVSGLIRSGSTHEFVALVLQKLLLGLGKRPYMSSGAVRGRMDTAKASTAGYAGRPLSRISAIDDLITVYIIRLRRFMGSSQQSTGKFSNHRITFAT